MKHEEEEVKNLSSSEVDSLRAILRIEQNGICPLCKKTIEFPCLDHQHKKIIGGSGRVRGVLCRSCNVFLGKIENNSIRYSISKDELPSVLRNIADYLEKEHLPYIHPSEVEKQKKLKKSSYNALKKIARSDKFPQYPRSGKLTKQLKKIYEEYDVEPEYYK